MGIYGQLSRVFAPSYTQAGCKDRVRWLEQNGIIRVMLIWGEEI